MVDEAVARGADVVCLSYYWFVGHSDGVKSPQLEEESRRLRRLVEQKEISPEEMHRRTLSLLAQPLPEGSPWAALADKASEHGVYIVGGSGPEKEGGKIYHTSPVFAPDGSFLGRHRKSILWDREAIYVAPGDDWEVFDLGSCRIANPICSEGQYVPEITRLLALRGADVLVVPNGVHLSKEMLVAIPVTRAIECQSYYVMIGQSPRGFRFPEIPEYTSCIVSPLKHMDPVLAIGEDHSCILLAELDIGRLRKEREMKTPVVKEYSVGNAVNDMVLGKYSYPMLTEHFLKAQNYSVLMKKYVSELNRKQQETLPERLVST